MNSRLPVLVLCCLALLASGAHAQEAPPAPEPTEPERVCVEGASDGYEQVVDLTFPVRGDVRYSDDYDQPRSGGRTHQGTDVVADKLQTVHAVLPGVVTVATGIDSPMPSYGYYLRIRHDKGLDSAYVHLNNDSPGTDDGEGGTRWAYAPGIRKGVRVERGQFIGYVGDSGNAEGTVAHLHFELMNPAWDAQDTGADQPWDPCLDDPKYTDKTRYNPYPSLVDAERRGDYPAPPPQEAGEAVARVAGSTRVLTSVQIARRFDPGVRAVIVVPEGSHAEALVAAPLAGLLDAPVLLAGQFGLHGDVVAEVARLDADNAYVIGREDQLSAATESQLREAGVDNVARIAEPDPFALSARIAREIRSYGNAPRLERVFLAVGEHADPARAWPDALSAGALAALTKSPVLLTRGGDLPAAVREVLEELSPPLVQVVGGTGAVSEAVAEDAGEAADADVERLSGANRFATSVAVAREAVELGLSAPRVWFATGHAFPDALAAGPAAAREGAPLLLIDGRQAGGAPEPEEWVGDRTEDLDDAVAVGGTAAITEAVRLHLAKVVGG